MMVMTSDGVRAIALGSFSLTLMGSLSLLSIWSSLRTFKQGIKHLRRLHQIPCHGCQYFTGDYRLKCPVQPLIACTDEAIGCHDFSAISRAQTSRPGILCSGLSCLGLSYSEISCPRISHSDQKRESPRIKEHFLIG